MELHHKVMGAGPPVVMLHGLFGDANNLGKVATVLSAQFEVHALEARNHGRSPHSEEMNYEAMAQDVLDYCESNHLDQVRLFGHSMGGKTAMTIALKAPNLVTKLVVADISPDAYSPHHNQIFAGLRNLALGDIRSRGQADEMLSEFLDEAGVRQFLLKSLYKTKAGTFDWRFNLPVLVERYQEIIGEIQTGVFPGEVLFVAGELSDYIQAKHRSGIESRFPNASLKVIQGTSHWLHAEKPELFSSIVNRFFT